MSTDLEYAIKQDIRNNPVVRAIDLDQKREFLRTLAISGLIVGMLLFSAWQHFKVVRSGMDLETLRDQLKDADAASRHLTLEIETLRRPEAIEQRALHDLRMIEPSDKDTITLERARAASPHANIVAAAR